MTTKNSSKFKKGYIPWNKGLKGVQKSSKKGKTLEELYGKEKAKEMKKLNSEKHKGNKGNKGQHWRIKDTSKMSKSHIGLLSGSKNPSWQGGISFEKYTIDWTKTLKKAIKERDKYICQICGIHQEDYKKMLDIHHIDYNKKNCNSNNLITLCRSCHTKTNFNRNKWVKCFKEKYGKFF